jgi:oxaloacetate decarboxylase alpha subunit
MDVQFVDTTFRDGSQSLWAMGMRTGMMEAVAEQMDQAGFKVIEVPVNSHPFKKMVRDLKEDPWAMCRMLAAKKPNTTKGCMVGPSIIPMQINCSRSMVKLYFERLAHIGVLNRGQIMANVSGYINNAFPWFIPMLKDLGIQVVLALAYTISPRHTDQYYAEKTRELVTLKPDAIYLKDQGGLLTVDRIRTLLPVILENAQGIPVEVHSHCTTGMADQVYMEALKLGVRTLHTAVPPLANGSSQPSIFTVASNARHLGYSPSVNEQVLYPVAQKLTEIAKAEHLPIGAPLPYDYSQYVYQIPGGVISNLKHQLKQLKLEHRLQDVLEESVRVRQDLGYPIMITPYSQFVVTQSTINVATGERYKAVIDELILFAYGAYGEDSGYTWMDPNLKDKLLSLPRAKELKSRLTQTDDDVPVETIRQQIGGPGVTDEELLLRYMLKGEKEIEAMRAQGPAKSYHTVTQPLHRLLDHLSKTNSVKTLYIRNRSYSLTLRKGGN